MRDNHWMTAWLRPMASSIAAVALTLVAAGAQAQDGHPTRPVRLIVPSTPGGGTDASARLIAPGLSNLLGQQVLVENRPGAAGLIGIEAVAGAAPDGHSLLVANSAMTIIPSMQKGARADLVRSLLPITQLASNPQVLVAHPSLPAPTLERLIAFAKEQPGKLDYAAGSPGGNPHMCMELLLGMTGMKLVHVPYKSGNAGLADVLAGQVPLMMAGTPTVLPHIKSGRLRAYGVTTAQRSSSLPQVPTIAEAGVPGYEANQWFGVLAPAGTPRDIVARLHRDLLHVLKDGELQKRFAAEGSEVVWSNSPEEFAALIRADEAKWAKVARDAGIGPQ
jgi:tripartite-type tricarboxylate transporter receptor subunit TctC